ncbi:MAG: Stk1 family PASTA domain-containing Ser/Thr kinase [Actinomycetota bacterium]
MIETTVDGRYQIISRIAAGGMGEVFRARDAVLDREVALKVLHPTFAGDSGFIERFRREARAAAMLNHPNIVGVHDWGQTNGTYFMVMEFVHGHPLRTILSHHGPLQPAQAAEAVDEVLAALDHAHRQGIVHRDVKPENVLITPDGRAKVADFGLARAFAESRITQAPGTVTGTVQYLAPEQIEGERADPRTDLYATGIVLYELLVGQVPFTGETSVAIAYKHLRERVPPPSLANPLVPEALDGVVLRATRREREERTPSAQVMRDELAEAVTESPPAPPLGDLARSIPPTAETPADRATTVTIPRTLSPTSRRRRRASRMTRFAAVLAFLVTLGWAGWAYVLPHQTTVPNLGGMSVAAAQRLAEEAGIDFEITQEVFSSNVAAGRILRQSITPGASVDRGSTLAVIISKGPELVEVPDLVGEALAAARRALEDVGLEVGTIERVFDPEVPLGRVIDQNPRFGNTLETGKGVDVTISRGPPQVRVPNVVGRSVGDAEDLLRTAGLGVRVTEEFSGEVARGNVISQSPAPNERIDENTVVTIVVSKGPREFPMPDVVGDTQQTAEAELRALGLDVRVVQLPGSSGNHVVGQDPEPGTTVRSGQEVTIYIGGN